MPTVLNPEEVASILENVEAEYWLITALLYGCGLRISEALSLRIKDIDLKSRNLLVFNGKGRKDRYTLMHGNLRADMSGKLPIHERYMSPIWSRDSGSHRFRLLCIRSMDRS
ncbi:tyrosine-type recombinase/integrase [Marinobacter sp.]|uniref:tyrosine-type recombinase/integrase n=1 Tax=Marinobacter sp. TaxID=50741 RepID=UPI002354CBDF|nr:tyrosine-type recombinase/integrase [Marinobacter sp.]